MYENIVKIIESLRLEKTITIDSQTALIGSERILDSLLLVELCLKLEDYATELGFTFDWTSTDAMSRSTSMFRNVESLVNEFEHQFNNKI
jgi:acyl carrier protein